jgi:hypothetical protein
MELKLRSANLEKLDQETLFSISGGNKISDFLSGACAIYGTYALVGVMVPGVNVLGAGSIGAFCAGYKLASWLF